MSRPRLPTLAIERLEDALALLVDNEPDVQLISRFAEKYENPTLLGAVNRVMSRMTKVERYMRELRQMKPATGTTGGTNEGV